MGYKIEAAIASVRYKEEALEMEVTESTQGFSVETGVVFNLGKRFFSELSIGHLYATDVLPEKKVKLGGFKAGLGLGVKF